MFTLRDVKDWELYDDQDGAGFTHIGFTDSAGAEHREPIEPDLTAQVEEVKRMFGDRTEIRLLLV